MQVREFSAARWVETGSSIVYIEHHFTITGIGGILGSPESNSYSRSEVHVYKMEADSSGMGERVLLFSRENTVPCGELLYSAGDSLLYFSFLEREGDNVKARHSCLETQHKRLLNAGKLAGQELRSLSESFADTTSLLTDLHERRDDWDSGIVIDSAYERLCVYQHCRQSSER